MKNRGQLILSAFLILSFAVYLSGCGGGGGGDNGPSITFETANSGWVTLNSRPSTVDSSPILLGGDSFISPSVSNAEQHQGVSGVAISWKNKTTGAGGTAFSYVACGGLFPPCVNSWYAYIPVAVGENRITVTASDSEGNSATASLVVTFIPGALKSVIATPKDGQVTLTWPNVIGAQSYNVYWSTSQFGGTWTKVPSATNQFIHSGLNNCTTYYYSVTTVSSYGESPGSLEVSATPVAVPSGVAADAGDGTVSVSWNNDSAYSYNIYWSTYSGVSKSSGTKIPWVTSPYIHSGLTNGMAYYYVVTAVCGEGEGMESQQVSAVPTPVPAGVSALAGDGQTR